MHTQRFVVYRESTLVEHGNAGYRHTEISLTSISISIVDKKTNYHDNIYKPYAKHSNADNQVREVVLHLPEAKKSHTSHHESLMTSLMESNLHQTLKATTNHQCSILKLDQLSSTHFHAIIQWSLLTRITRPNSLISGMNYWKSQIFLKDSQQRTTWKHINWLPYQSVPFKNVRAEIFNVFAKYIEILNAMISYCYFY